MRSIHRFVKKVWTNNIFSNDGIYWHPTLIFCRIIIIVIMSIYKSIFMECLLVRPLNVIGFFPWSNCKIAPLSQKWTCSTSCVIESGMDESNFSLKLVAVFTYTNYLTKSTLWKKNIIVCKKTHITKKNYYSHSVSKYVRNIFECIFMEHILIKIASSYICKLWRIV